MSRTSKITALYERLSRDDDLNGESNSMLVQLRYAEAATADRPVPRLTTLASKW